MYICTYLPTTYVSMCTYLHTVLTVRIVSFNFRCLVNDYECIHFGCSKFATTVCGLVVLIFYFIPLCVVS